MHTTQCFLCPFALGDITIHIHIPGHSLGRIPQGDDTPLNMDGAAIFAVMHGLGAVESSLGQHAISRRPFFWVEVRADDIVNITAERLLGRPAVHLLGGPIPGSHNQPLVRGNNRVVNILKYVSVIGHALFGCLRAVTSWITPMICRTCPSSVRAKTLVWVRSQE